MISPLGWRKKHQTFHIILCFSNGNPMVIMPNIIAFTTNVRVIHEYLFSGFYHKFSLEILTESV